MLSCGTCRTQQLTSVHALAREIIRINLYHYGTVKNQSAVWVRNGSNLDTKRLNLGYESTTFGYKTTGYETTTGKE